ncbi:MAG: hypothetical protein EPO23_06335 [Xanthobacteraceae bacterium]|nr:MAG: hypothetical protein EPO23_06335 [Xanthobacteraceae bacterium]
MSEHEAQQAAVRAKTARLRALRLAHEAANPPEPVAPKPVRKKAAPKSTKGGPAATLSSWLKDQQKGGHRT